MRITVRLFARLREIAGTGEIVRHAPDGASVGDVWRLLEQDYPAVVPYAASVSAAVNSDFARMDAQVVDGDEVAFLPPVSGGSRARRARHATDETRDQ